ncbi:MAG TPA: M13 family metallopeptidase [Candidatus Paceibacterota bacterium]
MKHTGWGFDIKNIDASVRPQDDFYHYAAGGWLKKAKIPPHESRWGSFHTLRHKTDLRLRTLLEEVSKRASLAPGSPGQMVRDLYIAASDMKTRRELGTKPIEGMRELIKGISSHEELIAAITQLHRLGTGGLWGFSVDQDAKQSEKHILYIHQGGLGLPDREYYLKDAPEQERVRRAYRKHIVALLTLAGFKKRDAEKAREVILRVEGALAKSSMKQEEMRDPEKIYHKYTSARLARLTPAFDWRAYFKHMGVKELRNVIVMQPGFFTEVERLFSSVSINDWKTYLEWHLINDFARTLSPAFEKQSFAFYGTVLSGVQKMRPRWNIALGTVNACVGEQLGKLYVEKYFGPEAKKRAHQIVRDLVTVYERRIRNLDWMSPATKKRALVKLHAVSIKLGYPNTWKSYRGLVVRPDDHFGNLARANAYELRRMLNKLGKPIDRAEWFMYPHTVNAYYAPSMNDIAFPAGILQHPFFDLASDDAVNYGAMGMTVGHELTHGFDDEGSQFNANGNLKNWWSKADRAAFDSRAKVVRKQYDAFVVEGLKVNGRLTLGENIADLGGLAIAFEAYQDHLKRAGGKDIGGFTPDQRFFLAYAQCEYELSRPEIVKLAILTDPHAPSICRVNGPLSNMPEFYGAFGVKKGDKLYRAPKSRAKIW